MSASAKLRLFAVAAPGLERLVGEELLALGEVGQGTAGDAVAGTLVPGGVEFGGSAETLYAANLQLRCASRILLRLGEVGARDFATLRRGIAGLTLSPYLPRAVPLTLVVKASAERCRLYHTGALSESLAEALSQAGYAVAGLRTTAGEDEPAGAAGAGASAALWLRGVGDRFQLSLDTSGALLHQRGYRKEAGAAPLRETLAAALGRLAGYRGEGALCDPLCGSGTLVIEAALRARRRAVGLGRGFAFADWPSFEPSRFAALVARLRSEERSATEVRQQAPLYASDCDPAVLALARRNAERAGVADCIEFAVADVGALRLPAAGAGGGLILTNPPYGRRLGDAALGGLYRKLARLARSAPGWRLALLTSQPGLARLALRHAAAIPLQSGGLRVALYVERDRGRDGHPHHSPGAPLDPPSRS